MIYRDNIKDKTKHVPFSPEKKRNNPDKFITYMSKNKPITYSQTKRIICDLSDKKACLINYRMLKFYVRHGMVFNTVCEIISFKQSNWLEKNINFNTQKRTLAKNDFEKVF